MITQTSSGAGGGGGADEKVKVSANDTTEGYLNGKLVAGTNITFSENNDGANETLTIAASGLTGFTASQNTASPNNTVNASRLLVDATSTNADAVIQPKGTGALLAQLPDGTSTGGNKRGTRALDLQLTRSSNTQVASGQDSIAMGRQCTASGTSSIAIGESAQATSTNSIGLQNGISQGIRSFAAGSSTASGTNSVAFGQDNTASNTNTFAIGGEAAASNYGQFAHATFKFSVVGDCQYERYVIKNTTTTNAAAELFSGSAGRIGIANDSTYTFTALVTARRTDADNESAGYKIEGVIDNNAGTTAFVGTPTVTVLAEDTAAWDVVVEADNTNDALVIKVTGETSKTIRWGAVVELMKVSG